MHIRIRRRRRGWYRRYIVILFTFHPYGVMSVRAFPTVIFFVVIYSFTVNLISFVSIHSFSVNLTCFALQGEITIIGCNSVAGLCTRMSHSDINPVVHIYSSADPTVKQDMTPLSITNKGPTPPYTDVLFCVPLLWEQARTDGHDIFEYEGQWWLSGNSTTKKSAFTLITERGGQWYENAVKIPSSSGFACPVRRFFLDKDIPRYPLHPTWRRSSTNLNPTWPYPRVFVSLHLPLLFLHLVVRQEAWPCQCFFAEWRLLLRGCHDIWEKRDGREESTQEEWILHEPLSWGRSLHWRWCWP